MIIYEAISKGDIELVKRLIADGKHRNVDGCLFSKINKDEDISIASMLIDAGCDINKSRDNIPTPLMHFVMHSMKNHVKLLLDKGVDVTIKNQYGNTALNLAVSFNEFEIVKMLVNYNKSIDFIDSENCKGNTALMQAAKGWHENIIKILIEAGADELKLSVNELIQFKLIDLDCIDAQGQVRTDKFFENVQKKIISRKNYFDIGLCTNKNVEDYVKIVADEFIKKRNYQADWFFYVIGNAIKNTCKNCNHHMFCSSMVKIMSTGIIFDKIICPDFAKSCKEFVEKITSENKN